MVPSRWPVVDKMKPGIGDYISKFATPIAYALRLDCVDRATRQLKPDSDCARRRDALNRLFKRNA